MKHISVLLAGGCMIPGWKLPPTCALPVLIKRAFRNNSTLSIQIQSDDKSQNPEQLYTVLRKKLSVEVVDIVVLQFFNNQLIPSIFQERPNEANSFYFLYRRVRRLEKMLLPEKWKVFLRAKVLGIDRGGGYLNPLTECISLVKQLNPQAKIFLLTPIAPTAKAVFFIKGAFYQAYSDVKQLALQHDVGVIDILTPLQQHPPGDIYREDGYHLTATGQRIVALSIVDALRVAAK